MYMIFTLYEKGAKDTIRDGCLFKHNTSTETLSPTNTACDAYININEKIVELLTSLFPSWPGHYSDGPLIEEKIIDGEPVLTFE